MKTNYNMIRNIFVQRALSSAFMEQKIKAKNPNFIDTGHLDFWFWRYVFMKDVTKKCLTNRLLEAGFDNLTTIEMIDALNNTRKIVKEILKHAKEKVQ